MPKISKNSVRVVHKDMTRYFDIEIFYNQKYKFYSPVTGDFKQTAELLIRGKENQKFNVEWFCRSRFGNPEYPIICGESEDKCLASMKEFIRFALDEVIEKRNVIIVYVGQTHYCDYKTTEKFDKHFPKIGMNLGIDYAVETIAGDNKVYNQYGPLTDEGESISRTEIRLHGDGYTIIDDTPENRKALETIFYAYLELIEKLKDITSTPKSLCGFIQSKVKLLS